MSGYVAVWHSEFQDGGGRFLPHVGDHPDILLNSAQTNGTTGLTINDTIVGPTDGFDMSVYRSSDGVVNAGDALMTTVRISEPTDLTPGPHTKSFTIGSAAGEIPLPGAGAPEVNSDYQMLFAADVLDQEIEDDADPLTEDNVARLTGVYHAPGGGVYVLGSAASDSVRITRGSVVVEIDGDMFSFPEDDVTDVRVRAQEGDDEVVVEGHTVPLMAHGGGGQDRLMGGGGEDHLSGGADEDQILGGDGDDMLDGGDSDDMLDGGEGDDTMDGGEGDNVVITFGNDSVVSAADTVIAYALPTLQVPTIPFSARGGSKLTFGGPDENRFTVLAPFPTGPLDVSLGASQGTLTLASLVGLTLVSGTGTDDTEVTLRGQFDDLNAALNGLTLTLPSTAGNVDLQVTLRESTTGGQQLDSETVSLTVLPGGQPVLDDRTFRVSENRPTGSVIGTLQAADPDVDQMLTYQILSGNTGNAVMIDEATGTLRVGAAAAFDFESTTGFTLVVQVKDNGTPVQSDTSTVTIEILDANDPPDARDDVFSLGGSMDPVSVDVLANDVTTPDVGEELTIIAVTRPSHGTVAIVAGKSVTYTPVGTPSAVDSFTYTVSDGRGGFDIALVSLATNSPPSDISLSNANVKERVSGLTIGTLLASDADAGQTLTLSTADSRFEIVAGVLKLKAGQFFDRALGDTVSVTIVATDSGDPPQSLSKTLLLQLVGNTTPWTNPVDPLDTNGDGTVAPSDVLRIINELNSPTILDGSGTLPKARPDDSSQAHFDVTGDGSISPLDALRVINFLNQTSPEGEASEIHYLRTSAATFANLTNIDSSATDLLHSTTHPRRVVAPAATNAPIATTPLPTLNHANRDRAFRSTMRIDELESLLDDIASDVQKTWKQPVLSSLGGRETGRTALARGFVTLTPLQ